MGTEVHQHLPHKVQLSGTAHLQAEDATAAGPGPPPRNETRCAALRICTYFNVYHRMGTKVWPDSPPLVLRLYNHSCFAFLFQSRLRSWRWATLLINMPTHQKPGSSKGEQQEEVSSISFLFPEERLYSTNHSNKLPAIRLAIYSVHSGFPSLKGPVAVHNIHSLWYNLWNILACLLLAVLPFVYNLLTFCV